MFDNKLFVLSCLLGFLVGYLMSPTVIIVLSIFCIFFVLYLFSGKEIMILEDFLYQTVIIFFLLFMWVTAIVIYWQPLQVFILPLKNFILR